jgi:deoxyribonuclease-1
MSPLPKYMNRSRRIEWEHIVPASLMPAHEFACWQNPEQFDDCHEADGDVIRGRACCEKISLAARLMIFDWHNLAPSIGQVNAYRLNDRYGMVADDTAEQWPGCGAQHFRASSASDHRFEPADCTKGDVARVWFYMHDQHGVVIPDAEWNMFVEWDATDPVSSWELERDRRVAAVQGNNNPYVAGFDADASGACAWDP